MTGAVNAIVLPALRFARVAAAARGIAAAPSPGRKGSGPPAGEAVIGDAVDSSGGAFRATTAGGAGEGAATGGEGAARGGAWSGWPASTWAALATLAFAVSLGGHGLFTYLLNTYGVLALSCAKLVEPVLAALGAYWLFGEPLSPRLGAAFALIATGVVVLLRSPRRGPREDLAEG